MLNSLLEKIAHSLDSADFPYMIIGGVAVLLYGEPRLTKDVDITLGAGPERTSDLLELAGDSAWRILAENPEDHVAQTMVLPCLDEESGWRIDFIFSFSPYELIALGRVNRVTIGTTSVCYAAVEDLVIHKIVAGRPRDLEDARSVLMKNSEMDFEYVHEWLVQFEETLSQPFVKQLESLKEDLT